MGPRAQFQHADLTNGNLQGAEFRQTDFRDAILYSTQLYGVDLSGAKLQGADLRRAQLHGAHLYSSKLHGADVSDSEFFGANLWRATLVAGNIINAQFDGADLKEVNLTGTQMNLADFFRADSPKHKTLFSRYELNRRYQKYFERQHTGSCIGKN